MNADFAHIAGQLTEIKLRISQAAERAGRKSESVRLVAVSKTFPAEAIMAAYEAGQRMFGENRVQEMALKANTVTRDVEWHLIGHLQSNKAAQAVRISGYIHSVDSEKLVLRLNRLSEEFGKKQKILLEINMAREESKFGLRDENEIMNCAESALKCPNIELMGVMTMAPYEASECELRRIFSSLRELRDKMERNFSTRLPELSMGMSNDFETAIAEGATIVRIGTAIFGKRNSLISKESGPSAD